MAQNKPPVFRFRLPWLLQPALATPPATAPEPPRTTVQTSVPSTSAPKPPFRPPGRAPPPSIVTPRVPPQSASSPVSVTSPPPPPPPPPPPVEAKSSVPKSPISKTLDPVAKQSTKETQTTTGVTTTNETLGPATPPQKTPSFRPLSPPPPSSPAKFDSQPSSPAKSDSRPSSPAKSDSRPSSPAKSDSRPSSPAKSDSRPLSPAKSDPQPSSPAKSDPQPLSPAKSDSRPSSPAKSDSRPSSPAKSDPQPSSPARSDSQPSSPAKSDSRPSSPAKSDSRPSSPAKSDPQPSSPAKSDSRPSSPAKSDSRPLSPAKFDSRPSSPAKSDSQPSSPSRTGTQFRDSFPPVSPSRMPTPPPANSKPLSPSRLATQPGVPTNLSSSSSEATQSIATPPTSHVNLQPSPASPPAPTTTTTSVQEALVNHGAQPPRATSKQSDPPENKRTNETTHDLGINAKPKEMTEVKGPPTKSMNPHSVEAKSPKLKPKPITAHITLHREIKDDISEFIHKLETSPPKQSMDEKVASVITLAGDNKGAIMHLGSDAHKREGAIDIQRGYKLNASNGEGSSNSKESQKDSGSSEDQETKAIVNSNVQGINNSIMFNSSVTERNPGVHLAFSRTLAKTDSDIESAELMEMYKAEADITPPETRVYAPTIGISLGGFFLEPSDCEPDDLEIFAEDYDYEIEVL